MATKIPSPATQLPEIIGKILSYLHPADLLSCTLVNRSWKTESEKYLGKTTLTRICCRQLSHFDVNNGRHAAIKLDLCTRTHCLPTLVTKLDEDNCLHKVTSLTTDWILNSDCDNFELYPLFDNLHTLELRPCYEPREEEHRPTVNSWIGKYISVCYSITLPQIETLIWNFSEGGGLGSGLDHLADLVLKMMPNLKTLKFLNVEKHNFFILMFRPNIYPNLRSLSVLTEHAQAEEIGWSDLHRLIDFPIHLSQLEFSLIYGDTFWSGWGNIIAKCAPTLEHLILRWISDRRPKPRRLLLPILPKLKILQILPLSLVKLNVCHHFQTQFPEIILKFVTATSDGVTLDYGTQFPSLVQLEINLGSRFSVKSWFETCLPFLYTSFLPPPSPQQRPCASLRLLNVPIPSNRGEVDEDEKWRVEVCRNCSLPQFSWRSTSDKVAVSVTQLSERVMETFPNLKNIGRYRHYFEEDNQLRARNGKMKEWLQLGEKLGLVTGLENFKFR